jgi:hypothetical protein
VPGGLHRLMPGPEGQVRAGLACQRRSNFDPPGRDTGHYSAAADIARCFESGLSGTDLRAGTIHAILAAMCYSGFLFLLRRPTWLQLTG